MGVTSVKELPFYFRMKEAVAPEYVIEAAIRHPPLAVWECNPRGDAAHERRSGFNRRALLE